MNLFEIKDYQVTFSPQALALKPFKALWDRDKSKDKDTAIKELCYVYFMCDYKSDYSDILDVKERSKNVAHDVDLDEKWEADDVVRKAMDFYEERRDGMIMRLYKAASSLLNKIVVFAYEVDLDERDKNNKPVRNIKQVNDIVKDLSNSAEMVQKLEKMVKAEISNNKDRLGSRSKALFEDGI